MAQSAAGRPVTPQQHGRGLSFAQQPNRNPKQRIEDEATIAYIKRTLCANTSDQVASAGGTAHEHSSEPLEQLLPPLTSSNEVDIQLYALIAVVLNLFVQTWYNRITPDQEFVASIVQIIAHCTRALEQRLRHVDLENLLLDELPELLSEHIDAVRISRTLRGATLSTAEIRQRYHALRPHPALSPVPVDPESVTSQQENEAAWCLLLVNRILPLVLPPEDLQNPCLDVLVSEILSELIFHNGICGKACEPWLLWDGITKLLRASRPDTRQATRRLDKYERLVAAPASTSSHVPDRTRGRFDTVSHTFWMVIQSVMTMWMLARTFLIALMQASTLQARPLRPSHMSDGLIGMDGHSPPSRKGIKSSRIGDDIQPIIGMHVWECVSKLLMLEQRTPWLAGMLSFLQWMALYGPGQLCCTNSRLDRLLSSQLQRLVLANPQLLPSLLQAARSSLFPNNAPAPPALPPSTRAEVLRLRRACAAAMCDALPAVMRTRFFATSDEMVMRRDVEGELEGLLGDEYLNRMLIVRVVEVVLGRLFPELVVVVKENTKKKSGDDGDGDAEDDLLLL